MPIGDWELLSNPPLSKDLANPQSLVYEAIPEWAGIGFFGGGTGNVKTYNYDPTTDGYIAETDITADVVAYNWTGRVAGGVHVIQGQALHYRYDLSAGTWASKALAPADMTGSHRGVVCNGEIWFTNGPGKWVIYTPGSDSWRTVNNPRPQHGGDDLEEPLLVAKGTDIWLISGQFNPGPLFANGPNVDVYDTVGNSYSTKADIEAANFHLYRAGAVDSEGAVYAIAGVNNTNGAAWKLMKHDEVSNTWSQIASPGVGNPVSARNAVMTYLDGWLYVYKSRRTNNATEHFRYRADNPGAVAYWGILAT